MFGVERVSGECERTVVQEERRGGVIGFWGLCEVWVDFGGVRIYWRRFGRGFKDVVFILMIIVIQDRFSGKEGSRKQVNGMAFIRVRCVFWIGFGFCEAEYEWDGEVSIERRVGRFSFRQSRVFGGGGYGFFLGLGDAFTFFFYVRVQRSFRFTIQLDMGRELEVDGDWVVDWVFCAILVQLEKISCFFFIFEFVGGFTFDMYVYWGCAFQILEVVCNQLYRGLLRLLRLEEGCLVVKIEERWMMESYCFFCIIALCIRFT